MNFIATMHYHFFATTCSYRPHGSHFKNKKTDIKFMVLSHIIIFSAYCSRFYFELVGIIHSLSKTKSAFISECTKIH